MTHQQIPVGQCFGLGEITTTEDITGGAAAGANIGRHNSRWLGNPTGTGYGTNFQVDSFSEDQPHHVKPEYEARLRSQLQTSHDAGLANVLAMDSDQLQGRMPGFNAWTNTREARTRRRQHIKLTHHYVKVFGPLLSYLEPMVEPQGPNATKELVWAYQTEVMLDLLTTAPHVRALIGGTQAYQPNYAESLFCPDWATSELAGLITITCNFQDDLVCQPMLFEDRLAKMLAVRDRWGVPMLVNQIWSDPANDPDGMFLATAIRRLGQERVGSIVWTACAKYRGGPGLSFLANPNDPNSAHIKHAARWAAVTEAWQWVRALPA